jgi:hypothetical protein
MIAYKLPFDKEVSHIYDSKAMIRYGNVFLSVTLQIGITDGKQIKCIEILMDVTTQKMGLEVDSISEYLNLYGNQLSSIYRTENDFLLGTMKGHIIMLKEMRPKQIFRVQCPVKQLLL